MTGSEFSYADLKKVEELKGALLDAFASNASLRAEKLSVEKKLAKIEAKLASNGRVSEVLKNPKYSSLSILKSKEFLRDIEEQAVKQRLRRKADRTAVGGRLTVERKRELLAEFAASETAGDKKLTTKMFEEWLSKAHGIKATTKIFLKPLGVPEEAYVPVSKDSRRSGTFFKIQQLKASGIIGR
jgi:hypothetical protein